MKSALCRRPLAPPRRAARTAAPLLCRLRVRLPARSQRLHRMASAAVGAEASATSLAERVRVLAGAVGADGAGRALLHLRASVPARRQPPPHLLHMEEPVPPLPALPLLLAAALRRRALRALVESEYDPRHLFVCYGCG